LNYRTSTETNSGWSTGGYARGTNKGIIGSDHENLSEWAVFSSLGLLGDGMASKPVRGFCSRDLTLRLLVSGKDENQFDPTPNQLREVKSFLGAEILEA
jgi:hypothetical protein